MLVFLAYNPYIIEGQLSVGNPLFGSNGVSTEQTNHLDVTAILGGLVVFVFYFMKFGRWPGPEGTPPGFRPKPTRHFTTWLRYIGWAMVYGFFMLFCYLLIIFFPKLFINFLDAYFGLGISGTETDLLQRSLNALKESPGNMVPYAVIIVTVVWSSAFTETERTFRRNLQELALIPTEANRLIEHYEKHHECFKANMPLARSVIRESPFKLISEATFTEDSEDRLEFRFAQCEYMLDQISRLRSKRYFARVLMRYQEDFDDAKVEVNKLRGKLQNYKTELIETLTASNSATPKQESLILSDVNQQWEESHEPSPFERRYFKRMWDQLEKDVLNCLRSILKIVICSVLAIGKSPYQRNALLKKFGLAAPDDIGPVFNREYAVRTGLVIVLTMLLCSGVYYMIDIFKDGKAGNCPSQAIPIPQNITEIAYWTFYAVTMHLLSIAGGYSIQKWLSEEHRQFEDSPRDVLKLSDCAACFIFGFCLNIFLFALLLFPQARWTDFQNGWMWALVAAVTAAFTGFYMTQKNKLSKIEYRNMAVQGLITAIFAFAVLLFIYDIEFLKSPRECPELMAYAIYMIVTTILIGAALSYILQEWICTENKSKRERTKSHGQYGLSKGER
jgi:hypothetical protein